jgi:hypothetical protein
MASLFMGDDEELQGLISTQMILPYLFGDFHPSHIQEYAGCLLLTLEKPAKDGGVVRPIICGESWRLCFASLAANDVRDPVCVFITAGPSTKLFAWGPISRIFTSTFDFFYRLQVSRTAPPTAPRFFPPCMPTS